ncbi:DUF6932 family protein [Amycolatopsis nigrescens]|uniref:DUF6932 family protein n=1 Tax=Amycolatopsis nigrescens TaxID=381445 RepID=UPI000374502E|nr:hypothetical protein [Amycolatopsis nigrescens]
MPLPHWTAEQVLPPGRHPADVADIYERLVFDAPHQNAREILFSALNSYLGVVTRVIPAGRAWVGGAFTTRGETVPTGLDVVLLPEDWGNLKRLTGPARDALYGLLTLRGVIIGQPVMYLDQVQPVGGLLDGFLCFPGDEETWAAAWSGDTGTGAVKGFPEVVW